MGDSKVEATPLFHPRIGVSQSDYAASPSTRDDATLIWRMCDTLRQDFLVQVMSAAAKLTPVSTVDTGPPLLTPEAIMAAAGLLEEDLVPRGHRAGKSFKFLSKRKTKKSSKKKVVSSS